MLEPNGAHERSSKPKTTKEKESDRCSPHGKALHAWPKVKHEGQPAPEAVLGRAQDPK